MEYHKNLKSLLDEALELRNVNLEKLSALTGIPERYIWAIQNVEIDKLPPYPYVRGYIKKISLALSLNHDEIWELYKKELSHKTSGAYDKLPSNRFAIKEVSKKSIGLGLLAILLLIYLGMNLNRLIGEPELIITNPQELIVAVTGELFELSGRLGQRRDKLLINNEEIFVESDGSFTKDINLQPGLNTIEFKAKRLLGREKIAIRQILYQPQSEEIINNNQ